MISNAATQAALTAAVRKIIAKVELYSGSTLVDTFYHSDKLINFTVERVGESSKFFGFGVGHKINIHLIDRERALNITTDHSFKVYLAAGYEGYIEPFSSNFFVTEVNRDENTNELSITAYDALNKAAALTVAGLFGGDLELVTEIVIDNVDYEMITSFNYTLKTDTDSVYISSLADISDIEAGGAWFSGNFGTEVTLPQALIDNGYTEEEVNAVWKAGTTIYAQNYGAEIVRVEATYTQGSEGLAAPYSIKDVAEACAGALGLGLSVPEGGGVEQITEVILDNPDLNPITEVSYTLKADTDTITVETYGIITYADVGGNYYGADFGTSVTFPDALFFFYDEAAVREYWKAGATVIIGTDGGEIVRAEATYTQSTSSPFDLSYEEGANIDGTETLREVLDDIAEATQTVYSVSGSDLVFKQLDRDGAAALRISRADYYTLDSKTNRRLSDITSATELGDNVTAGTGATGTEQIMRDNAFLELREDIAALLNDAIERMGGITINQFELDWRGNFLLQIGDKLELETKDGGSAVAYLLDDSLTYNGGLQQRTRWSFDESESEDSNPTNLGEAIKQTFARVNKANKQIDIVASETEANAAALASLQINTESINATVEKMQSATTEAVDELSESVATLKQSVEAGITAEDVTIAIKEELSNGVDKVETATGFKFDADGLEVSKSGSEMTTKITEDGMEVAKDGETVLTANNQGVNAQNLHATTFLIVGNSSRFEDYEKDGEQRTGCFWIGGAS